MRWRVAALVGVLVTSSCMALATVVYGQASSQCQGALFRLWNKRACELLVKVRSSAYTNMSKEAISDDQLLNYVMANTNSVETLMLQIDYGRDLHEFVNGRVFLGAERKFIDSLGRDKEFVKWLSGLITALKLLDDTVALSAASITLEAVSSILQGFTVYKLLIGVYTAVETRELATEYFAQRCGSVVGCGQGRRPDEVWRDLSSTFEPLLARVSAKTGARVENLGTWFETAFVAYRLVGYADSNDVRSRIGAAIARTAAPAPSVIPQLTVSPSAGPRGTTFSQPGQGFTPNSTATVHYGKPDGTEYPPVPEPTDSQGRYLRRWTPGPEVPTGTYQAWAVDNRTGRRSPVINYTVTAQTVLPGPSGTPPAGGATSPAPQDVRASQAVTDSFQKVLGRAPTSSERDLYVDLLASGRTQTEIENALRTTGEYKSLEIVSQAFQKVLGRQATPRERDNFVTALKAGRTEADVEAALMATDEYRRRVAGGQPANPPPVTQSVTPQVTVSPSAGPRGTTFSQPGQGFTPNSTVTVHYRKPDGSEYPPVTQPTDSQGRYLRQWTPGQETQTGVYQAWAVDDRTGRQSPVISYTVTAQTVLPGPSGTPAPGGATPPLTTTGTPTAPAPSKTEADLRKEQPDSPVLSSLTPNPVAGLDGFQILTLTGSGFARGAQVTLRTGGQSFLIPPERTSVLSASQIQIRANVTRTAAAWTVEVTNPGDRASSRVPFSVTGPAPARLPSVAQPAPSPPVSSDAATLHEQIVRALRLIMSVPPPRTSWGDLLVLSTTRVYDNYQGLYLLAVNRRYVAGVTCIGADRLLRSGLLSAARDHHHRCLLMTRQSDELFKSAEQVYSTGVEIAGTVVEAIYRGAKEASLYGSHMVCGPPCFEAADLVFSMTDFMVDASEEGADQAAKQLLKRQIVKMVLSRSELTQALGKGTTRFIGRSPLFDTLRGVIQSPEYQRDLMRFIGPSGGYLARRGIGETAQRLVDEGVAFLGGSTSVALAPGAQGSDGPTANMPPVGTPPASPAPPVMPTPVLSAVSPNPVLGQDGYQALTLTGSGLAPGAQVTLRTGGESFLIPPERTSVLSTSQIQIRANVTRTAASWTAEVTNPGSRVSGSVPFTVVVAAAAAPPPPTLSAPPPPPIAMPPAPAVPIPVVSGVSPNPVPGADGLQVLAVTGSGFVPGSQVTLRTGSEGYAIPADRTTVASATQIQVRVNVTKVAAAWTAEVTNPGGRGSSRVAFNVVAPAVAPPAPPVASPPPVAIPQAPAVPIPVVTGVSPNPVKGADGVQMLTVTGTGFVSGSQVTLRTGSEVYAIPADRTTVVSATQIQLRVNVTRVAAAWTAEVTNPGGRGSTRVAFNVVAPVVAPPPPPVAPPPPKPTPPPVPVPQPPAVPSPAVSGVSPNPMPGLDGVQVLTVTGSGFVPGSQVTLRTGSEVYSIPSDRTTVVSATQIQVRVNVTKVAAAWTAEVTNPGGKVSGRAGFSVVRR